MTAPTHVAFGNILFFALANALGIPLNATTVSMVSFGSLISDIDTPTSAFGRTIFPLARWVEGRWGHRTITHSLLGILGFGILFLPLLFFHSVLYKAFLIGVFSHPIIDMVNTTGVAFFWPSERRVVFPYVEKEPTKLRIMVGSFHEMVLLGVLVAFVAAFYPVGQFGFRRVLHYMLGNPHGAVEDYRRLAGSHKVFAEIKAIDLVTQQHFEGTYEVLGALGQTTLIFKKGNELYTLGLRDDCNYYPKKVRVRQAEKINVITQEVDMSSRMLGDIRYFMDPTKEQYLYGALKVEGNPNLTYKFRCYNTIFKYYDFIMFNIATWEDIKETKLEGVYVTNGKLTIKTLLKEGEKYEGKDMVRASIDKEGYQKPINISFYIQTIEDLFVKEGDEIKIGQVLALDRREEEKINKKSSVLAKFVEEKINTESFINTTLNEIALEIKKEEENLKKIKKEEEDHEKLYEAGVIAKNELQRLREKREEIERKIERLKIQYEKEHRKGQFRLFELGRQMQSLREEIEEHREKMKVVSKMDGIITALHLSDDGDCIKVQLEILARILPRGGKDGRRI